MSSSSTRTPFLRDALLDVRRISEFVVVVVAHEFSAAVCEPRAHLVTERLDHDDLSGLKWILWIRCCSRAQKTQFHLTVSPEPPARPFAQVTRRKVRAYGCAM